ncbi:MAG: C4-dicarboxylate ABC transporter substrate-binding protein [Spirochaeta sp. LUC14_002_19_P3]|nr:MAG: C4-dicarboxylate ABC transporter substrate-binding protein [Spirochaeta sp. LUC14_002_19_P3]
MKKVLSVIVMLALIAGICFAGAQGEGGAKGGQAFATIGTGGVTGVYYPTGGAISKMVNAKSAEYNLRVTVESTGGSVYNVNAIMSGDLEFGIVQSDRQFQAYNGSADSDWEGKPQEKLRAVFSIHPESVTLLASDESGIKSINDLRGKVVNIGNPGSGQRGNAMDILEAAGIDPMADLKAEGLQASESAGMLQDGRIDAYFYTVGHPSGSFIEATSGSKKVRFVPIEGPAVDALVKANPYYAKSIIPVKANYPNAVNGADVPSFGVKATLCTSADVSDAIVYAIVKEVFDNLEDFKALHPAYAILKAEDMLTGLSAPLHPGAEKYFMEAGLR